MATIEERERSVLLIVDVQVGVLVSAYRRNEVIGNIAKLITKARSSGIPIMWVQQTDSDLPPETEEWEIVPELKPDGTDLRLRKKHNSSFEETGLEAMLRDLGITRIVLAGAATNWCIRSTAFGALERAYDLCLISDAHTTESLDLENGRTIKAQDLIDDLNTAMAWLSYPGRRNESKTTAGFLQEEPSTAS